MKKIIVSVITSICLLFNTGLTAFASSSNEIKQNYSVYTVGLISYELLGISSSSNNIMLTAQTSCTDSMKYVGLKDVVIEQSSDGVNWNKYTRIGDLLSENSTIYVANNLSLATVTSGYYYRVTCSHYAKEKGLFGSSEKDDATSNSIYIKKFDVNCHYKNGVDIDTQSNI